MKTAKILKSTQSSKGGFVNTMMISETKKHSVLGEMSTKRAIFYKTTEAVEITGEEFEFDLNSVIISKISSDKGDGTTSEWIVGFN